MSSIFSDPQFRRGTTLFAGEDVPVDASGNPIGGSDVVGSVKAFQDADPGTRGGERLSSRLVYCVATRYTGSTVSDSTTIAGQTYAFDASACLSKLGAAATSANVNAGVAVGVLDEYLKGELKQNDVVWVVVKGPTTAKSSGTLAAGAMVFQSATAGTVASTGSTVALGQAIGAAAGNKVRVNLHSNII